MAAVSRPPCFEPRGSKVEEFGLETEPTSANRRNQMKFQVGSRHSNVFTESQTFVSNSLPSRGIFSQGHLDVLNGSGSEEDDSAFCDGSLLTHRSTLHVELVLTSRQVPH